VNKRLPVVKPKEVVTALEKAGWYVHRKKGSHVIMHKAGSRNMLVIPLHTQDMPKGTLRGILSDAELDVERFIQLLKK
jgi:predicted RNA binding protein YcfA (HicA-like mRNA interferase family)